MKRLNLILSLLFIFLSGLELSAQDSEIKLARSASDPGVNAVAYNFTGNLKDSNGGSHTVGGMLALRSTGNGTVEGALIDTLSGVTYSITGSNLKGFRLTFTGDNGSTFTGTAAAFAGNVPPASLSGQAGSGLTGTWTATDASYFSFVPPVFTFPDDFACTLCQLTHFCGVITTIPCTACTKVCRKKRK